MVAFIRAPGDRSIRSYIDAERGTISRETYVNPDIFDQEMEQIFQRCWLLLGHESQIPNPGDFVVTRMGTEEVIMVRDRKDKQIRAFLNSCRHRGEKVCRYDQGNSLVFTCPFHAWTYDTKGKLVGAGFQNSPEAYTDTLNKAEWGLVEVAQLCNFYGLIWPPGIAKPRHSRIIWAHSRRAYDTACSRVMGRMRGWGCSHRSSVIVYRPTGRFPASPR